MLDFKVLLADDDKALCSALSNYLKKEGFTVVTANDGNEAIFQFNSQKPGFIVLDILMPNKDGLQVCQEIRKISQVPIIFTSIKNKTFDIVLGFELGADDYLTKPFEFKELLARMKAIMRRNRHNSTFDESQVISYDKMTLDMSTYQLILDGKPASVSAKELELLYCLVSAPNKVFSRNQLLDRLWGVDYCGDLRTVDVHIKRLRYVLDGVSPKWRIKTVWGMGYKFEVDK